MSAGAFAREVAEARVYEGIHFRTSTEIGAAMGKQIGELAAARLLGQSTVAGDVPTAEESTARVHANRAAGDLERERTLSFSY